MEDIHISRLVTAQNFKKPKYLSSANSSLSQYRPKAYRLASQYSDSSNCSSNGQAAFTSTEDRLDDRRRQSLRVMAAMSLNKAYSDAINGVSINKSDLKHEEGNDTIIFNGIRSIILRNKAAYHTSTDCTSKLQEIFIRAKESGMTYDEILKKFCLKHEVTSVISSKAFAAALRKLSPDVSCLTEVRGGKAIPAICHSLRQGCKYYLSSSVISTHFHLSIMGCFTGFFLSLNYIFYALHVRKTDVGLLVRKFEVNEDKVVSLDDVKAFALAIPHVSWKVERIRRLSSALSLSDSTNRSDSGRVSFHNTNPFIYGLIDRYTYFLMSYTFHRIL